MGAWSVCLSRSVFVCFSVRFFAFIKLPIVRFVNIARTIDVTKHCISFIFTFVFTEMSVDCFFSRYLHAWIVKRFFLGIFYISFASFVLAVVWMCMVCCFFFHFFSSCYFMRALFFFIFHSVKMIFTLPIRCCFFLSLSLQICVWAVLPIKNKRHPINFNEICKVLVSMERAWKSFA